MTQGATSTTPGRASGQGVGGKAVRNVILFEEAVPLQEDGQGGKRIGTTRVRLESVLALHRQGLTAEQIVDAFDTLRLDDVCAVLVWVSRHPREVAAYTRRREKEAREVRQRGEALGIIRTAKESELFRKELLARKARRQQGKSNAAVSD